MVYFPPVVAAKWVPSPTNGQVAQLSKQIFAANAALIGANPDLIRPGLALTIPTKG